MYAFLHKETGKINVDDHLKNKIKPKFIHTVEN